MSCSMRSFLFNTKQSVLIFYLVALGPGGGLPYDKVGGFSSNNLNKTP